MKKVEVMLIVFSISLLLFLVLFSYKIILFFTNLNPEQHKVVNFVQGKGNLAGNLTADETSHLKDVQKVMNRLDYVFYFLLLVITLIITSYRQKKENLRQFLNLGGKVMVISIVLIMLLSLLNFEFLFTAFHHLFFPQGNWVFPVDSLLIQTFPIEFFIKISRNILLLALSLGVFFILISLFKRRTTKQV